MGAKCVIFLNQKGGVAKTTSTYNIAAAKAKEGHAVLMIDLDPQASLTIAAGIEPGEERLEGFSTCDLFNSKVDPLEAVFSVKDIPGVDRLFIVPSDINLANTEKELITMVNGENKLKKAIKKLREHFSYIFIDCPPQLGLLSINAMVAADVVVIPCKTDYLSYRGLKALVETIDEIKEEELNPDLEIEGIIGTFYESNVILQRQVLEKMESFGYSILGTIRKSTDITRNLINGQPAITALPNSKVAIEYQAIADKL